MSQEINLHLMTVDIVAQKCAEQTERFHLHLQDDSIYCFELFRRAICERIEEAWTFIYNQYRSQVEKWVVVHVGPQAGDATINGFVNDAFAKMWRALTVDKFAKFSDLKAILAYLKLCVYSVIVDHNRLGEPPSQYLPDESPAWGYDPTLTPEEAVIHHEKSQALWVWVNERVHDDKERLVLYGCYALDLKPQALFIKFPKSFSSVAEIYIIKQNILARLQRDPDCQKFFATHT